MSLAFTSPGPVATNGALNLVGIGVHAHHDVLEVEDDVGDILLDPGDGRELVGNAFDSDALDRRSAQRGEKYAARLLPNV